MKDRCRRSAGQSRTNSFFTNRTAPPPELGSPEAPVGLDSDRTKVVQPPSRPTSLDELRPSRPPPPHVEAQPSRILLNRGTPGVRPVPEEERTRTAAAATAAVDFNRRLTGRLKAGRGSFALAPNGAPRRGMQLPYRLQDGCSRSIITTVTSTTPGTSSTTRRRRHSRRTRPRPPRPDRPRQSLVRTHPTRCTTTLVPGRPRRLPQPANHPTRTGLRLSRALPHKGPQAWVSRARSTTTRAAGHRPRRHCRVWWRCRRRRRGKGACRLSRRSGSMRRSTITIAGDQRVGRRRRTIGRCSIGSRSRSRAPSHATILHYTTRTYIILISPHLLSSLCPPLAPARFALPVPAYPLAALTLTPSHQHDLILSRCRRYLTPLVLAPTSARPCSCTTLLFPSHQKNRTQTNEDLCISAMRFQLS